jgi:hypothetical protein
MGLRTRLDAVAKRKTPAYAGNRTTVVQPVPSLLISIYFTIGSFSTGYISVKSRDSSVGIATGYGQDDRMIGVRFPEGAGNFSLRHHVLARSGAHPASYLMGTRNSFLGGKAAGA